MWEKLVLFLVLFLLLIDNISASVNPFVCFFDRNEKSVQEFGNLTLQHCTTVMNDTNSTSRHDDGSNVSCDRSFKLGSETEKFELSTGVGKDNHSKEIIVLNVTISHITFHKLSIRHQNLGSGNGEIYWQTIEFKENQIPEKLAVFSSVWECHRTKIQFFAEGSEDKFFKEFHFIPKSTLDPDGDGQRFAYVDTTFQDKVYLHVQPHINITRYIVEFQHVNEKGGIVYIPPAFNLSADDLPYEQTNFPENANYKFSLVPVDNNGKNYTAIPVAIFCMQTSCETLFKMKLGFGATVVILIFLMVIAWLWFKKNGCRKLEEKPKVLLLYSATHDAHINVMINLAEHLKQSCELMPMLDVLDIPKETHKNPSHWYESAFQKADIVLVVSSPKCNNAIVTESIYKDLDNHAQKLIQEDRPHSKKKYFALILPYCKKSDLFKEAETFSRLQIKDLKKLVSDIYRTKYTKVKNPTPDEQKLIQSIKSAKGIIMSEEPISKPKNHKKMTDPILPKRNEVAIDMDRTNRSEEDNTTFTSHYRTADKIKYATDIEGLNLLGNEKTE